VAFFIKRNSNFGANPYGGRSSSTSFNMGSFSRVALVTGETVEIGASIAEALLAAGIA
jgi:hypothetical protein